MHKYSISKLDIDKMEEDKIRIKRAIIAFLIGIALIFGSFQFARADSSVQVERACELIMQVKMIRIYNPTDGGVHTVTRKQKHCDMYQYVYVKIAKVWVNVAHLVGGRTLGNPEIIPDQIRGY